MEHEIQGKIRKKSIKKNKRYKLFKKTLAVAGAALMFVGASSLIAKEVGAFEPTNESIITQYFGQESRENDIASYITLSKELEKLNLEKYEVAPNLFEKYNISSGLKSPEEIKVLIDGIRYINSFVSSKNITKQSENIETVLNLINQKALVNEYIYNIGYEIALNNIEDSTKKYTAEVFGVKEENLSFSRNFDNKSGENLVSIKNDDGKYIMSNVFLNDAEKDIKKGVIVADQTRDSFNKYSSEYDKDRNDAILNALKTSAQLYEENDEKDLYNERMASKLK